MKWTLSGRLHLIVPSGEASAPQGTVRENRLEPEFKLS